MIHSIIRYYIVCVFYKKKKPQFTQVSRGFFFTDSYSYYHVRVLIYNPNPAYFNFSGFFTLMETTSPQSKQTVYTLSEPIDNFLSNGRRLMKSDACTKDVLPQSVHFFTEVLICSFHLCIILDVFFNKLYSSNWNEAIIDYPRLFRFNHPYLT